MSEFDIDGEILRAVYRSDVQAVRLLLTQHPEYKTRPGAIQSWIHQAARESTTELVDALIDLGVDVNSTQQRSETTPLDLAMSDNRVDMVKHLLRRGANPNIGRSIIGAINKEPEEVAFQFVELLVEHGADVNRVFPYFGDMELAFTPLGWAVSSRKVQIADYLRSKGAVMSDRELKDTTVGPKTIAAHVIAHFAKNFGPVDLQAMIEIVPTGMPVSIHVSRGRKSIALFTTGMSDRKLKVPKGMEAYRLAELYIELPAKWPLTKEKLANPQYVWPVFFLRDLARHPHEKRTWFGDAATIVAYADPPEPLAPNLPFTSIMLMAEDSIEAGNAQVIQLYRLFPLYTEERDLEIKQGLGALVAGFQKAATPFVVDLKRRNVGLRR